MAYQVLSLKWRPQSFNDIVGQDHVTLTLVNAFKKDRVAQGYILTGPRGVGKTTTARIIAKALNCPKTQDGNPCNKCNVCQEITNGHNLDVLEIDGASNRGIEEIRNLREQIKYAPMNSPYKVFIIDEVHMLTNQAFNALLRTLEEPPAHGKFIFATTDIHKVPSTIISRCQRFDFNRITDQVIISRLSTILDAEKITIDDESLAAISRKADGSVRDALSILDQVIAFAGDSILFEDVVTVIGIIPYDIYFDFSTAISNRDSKFLLSLLKKIRSTGFPLEDVLDGLNQHFRNLMVATVESGIELLQVTESLAEKYKEAANSWDVKDLLRITKILIELQFSLKRAAQPNILFEITAFKLLEMDRAVSIENLLNNNFKNVEPPSAGINLKKADKTNKTNSSGQVKPFNQREINPISIPHKEGETKESIPLPTSDIPSVDKISLDIINKGWVTLVSKISKKRQSISMVLEHSLPVELEGRHLLVHVFDLPKFSVSTLEKNLSTIEEYLEEHYGVTLRLKAEWKPGEGPQLKIPKNIEKEQTEKKGDPVIDRIIEQFDGEILR